MTVVGGGGGGGVGDGGGELPGVLAYASVGCTGASKNIESMVSLSLFQNLL